MCILNTGEGVKIEEVCVCFLSLGVWSEGSASLDLERDLMFGPRERSNGKSRVHHCKK